MSPPPQPAPASATEAPPAPQEVAPEEGPAFAEAGTAPIPQPPVATAPPARVAAAVASTQVRVVSAVAEAHCRAVAQQRKEDAEANEYDDETVDQIYDGTLKNCMKWEADHPQ